MSLLRVENINKAFDRPALIDVNLSIQSGEIVCLLGPSGCGKTTLLRIIAGLEAQDSGRILFNGMDMKAVSPHQRSFGLMFQEFALFPHKTVLENVSFGLEMQKLNSLEVRRRAHEILALVGLEGFEHRNTGDLSGGERQRAALARSLAPGPGILMLDEPLGALDRPLRERLLPEIRRIIKSLSITAIFVTHDQTEAFGAADRVGVMSEGRLLQLDSPEDLYLKPNCETAARFLGFHNIVEGVALSGGLASTSIGKMFLPGLRPGEGIKAVIRPEAARLVEDGGNVDGILLSGVVEERMFIGRFFRVTLKTDSNVRLVFDLENDRPPPLPGETIHLTLDPGGVVLLGLESG